MKIVYICIVAVLILFGAVRAFALTPQKYCESLATTSCEVLNISAETNVGAATGSTTAIYSPSIVNIKYCRNRVFKAFLSSIQTHPAGSPYLPYTIAMIRTSEVWPYPSKSYSGELASASLCSGTWSDSSTLLP